MQLSDKQDGYLINGWSQQKTVAINQLIICKVMSNEIFRRGQQNSGLFILLTLGDQGGAQGRDKHRVSFQ